MPVTCKVRLLDSVDDTIVMCKMLVAAGARCVFFLFLPTAWKIIHAAWSFVLPLGNGKQNPPTGCRFVSVGWFRNLFIVCVCFCLAARDTRKQDGRGDCTSFAVEWRDSFAA